MSTAPHPTAARAKTNGSGRAPRALPAVSGPGLHDALLAVQSAAPKLRKDATGQVQNRTYGYVTLDGMLDDVVPLLVEHALLWTARPALSEHGFPAVLYRMTHVPSGECDEWTGPLPIAAPGPQSFGSALTYMRRYTLLAYLNLAPGEDDDGAAASAVMPNMRAGQNHVQNEFKNEQILERPATSQPSERRASPAQGRLVSARAAHANLSAVQLADLILRVAGQPARDWSDRADARRWVDRALPQLPARLIGAVLHAIAADARPAGENPRAMSDVEPDPWAPDPWAPEPKPPEPLASARQRALLKTRAAAAGLDAGALANALCLATDGIPRPWETEQLAERWTSEEGLPGLPARCVDAALEQIAKAAGKQASR